jgi:hypothetical protein
LLALLLFGLDGGVAGDVVAQAFTRSGWQRNVAADEVLVEAGEVESDGKRRKDEG